VARPSLTLERVETPVALIMESGDRVFSSHRSRGVGLGDGQIRH
jgi:hypothetical protein